MKSISTFLLLGFAAFFCNIAWSAAPETLKLPDLVNRPDRWPASVTLKKDIKFSDGAGASKGQKLQIIQFQGSQLGVDGGNNLLFEVAPDDTDFLEAANTAWTKLTPAQRAIDANTLLADSSLWPDKVKCTSGFTLDSGKDLPPGGEYDLVAVDAQGVTLFHTPTLSKLSAHLAQTDAIAGARERALIEPEKRTSRVAEALRKNLVDSAGKPVTSDSLDGTKVFALYYGASWCGPCRAFSPGFVKYINEVAAKSPNLTVVLVSNDKTDADMLKYMTEEKMPFNAVPMAAMNKSPVLMTYPKGGIPQLVIVDRYGKVLADSYQGQRYVGPKYAQQALSKILASGAAK
jgi:nucleoredoxin